MEGSPRLGSVWNSLFHEPTVHVNNEECHAYINVSE